MDWLTYSAQSIVHLTSWNLKKIERLFVTGAQCQLLVERVTSTICNDFLLKLRDAVLVKSFVDLRSTSLSSLLEPFSKKAVAKAVEKSSRAPHDEASHKAITLEKPSKKFQFSQSVWQSQLPKHSGPQFFRQSAGKGGSLYFFCWVLNLPLPLGGGRSFEGFSPSSQRQVGDVLGQHWDFWSFCRVKDWMVKVFHSGYPVPFHHLPPVSWEPLEYPSYGLRSVKAQALQDKVEKMLEKSTLELAGCAGLGFYSRLFLVQKATGEEGVGGGIL